MTGYEPNLSGDRLARERDQTGFLGALFDLSFRSFITSKLVKVLYVLAIGGIALVALMFLGMAVFSERGGVILFAVVAVPLSFILGIAFVRVLLELVIVIFRISEGINVLAAGQFPSSGPAPSHPNQDARTAPASAASPQPRPVPSTNPGQPTGAGPVGAAKAAPSGRTAREEPDRTCTCGTLLLPAARFCTACGTQAAQPPSNTP